LVGGACTNGRPLIRLLGGNASDAAPVVAVQPTQSQVTVGQWVTLTAWITSVRPFRCAWSRDDQPLSGATNAMLTLTNVVMTQAGTYTITVSNELGTSTASVNLGVTSLSASVGKLDLSYNAGTRPQVMDGFYALALEPDGGAVLGGGFTSFNGVVRTNLVRVDASGNVDTNFNAGRLAVGTYPDWVQGLARQDDGKLVVAGRFSRRLLRIDALGAFDPTLVSGSSVLYAVALQPDGRALIGGQNTMRRLTVAGGYDGSFNAGLAPNPSVRAIAVQPDGKILAGGDFTTLGGATRPGLVRLNIGGDLDYSFDARMTGAVAAVVVQLDGKIIVGGSFRGTGGAARNGLARLNADGSVDAAYAPGSGLHATAGYVAAALALQPDGKLLVGGVFNSVDGTARRMIVRLNPDGRVDPTFDPGGGPDGPVYALALQPDGKVIIAGDFNNVSGTPRDRLARLFGDYPPPIPPRLSLTTLAGGQIGVSFLSEPNRTSTLEWSDSLAPAQWSSGSSCQGDGSLKILLDTNPPVAQRCYRLRVE